MMRCPYCMKEVGPGQICQGCGKDPFAYHSEAHHFPAGQLLNGRYLVGAALGEGGFGITYLGLDTKLERRVAIKEYFPRSLVRRESSATLNVTCYTGSDVHFEKGREQFLREAQVLARLDAFPEIVHVLDYFAENNSAYIVMEFLEGVTLKDLVAQRGMIGAKELFELLEPVIKGLDTIHREGLIHRDISPDNLMIMHKNNQVKLMDFGCARELGMGHTMTIMLKPGFAPAEQYTGHEQGPWTDIYALCATIYYCLTGKVPPEAMIRMGNDTLIPPSQLGMGINANQERALLKGLALQIWDRWQTAEELYIALYGKTPMGIPIPSSAVAIGKTETVGNPAAVEITPVAPAMESPRMEGNWQQPEAEMSDATEYGEMMPPNQTYFQTEYANMPDNPWQNYGQTEYANMSDNAWQNYAQTEYGPLSSQEEEQEEKPGILLFFRRPMGKIAVAGILVLLLLLGGAGYWFFHPHSYGQWQMKTAATCSEAGSKVRTCFCGKEEKQTIPALGHTEVIDEKIEASCDREGKTAGSHCSVCEVVLKPQEIITTKSHQTEKMEDVAATCTADGSSGGSWCRVCKTVLQQPTVIPKVDHEPIVGEDYEATCIEEGRVGGVWCRVCDAVLEEPVILPVVAHVEVADPAVKATCAKEGKTAGSHCSVCNLVIQEQKSIPKTDHTIVTDRATTVSCTTDEKTEGSHCSVCNKIIKEQKITQYAYGHSYSKNQCTRCGSKKWQVSFSKDKSSYNIGDTAWVTVSITCAESGATAGIEVAYNEPGSYSEETIGKWQIDSGGFSQRFQIHCDEYGSYSVWVYIRETDGLSGEWYHVTTIS